MTFPNSDQVEFWNDRPGISWARHSDSVDAMFGGFTDAILDESGVRSDDRVLDLGCGAGGLSVPLAERATDGSVTAIDVSEPMMEVARRRAREAGVDIRFVLGDAAVHPLGEGVFDLLASRLGAMFFDDPVRAFSSLRRSLAPGARAVLAVWREPRDNPWAMAPVSAVRPHLEIPPRSGPEEPGPFAFADPDRVRRILREAGFVSPTCTPLDLEMPVGGSVAEAVGFLIEVGPLATPFLAADDGARQRARNALADMLEDCRRGDEIMLGGGCWIVAAGV